MSEVLTSLHRIILFALLFVVGSSRVCAQTHVNEEVSALPDTISLQADNLTALQQDTLASGVPQAAVQEETTDLYFELLTCSPGSEVYELYGHTALRAVDSRGLDVVFNYGVFDFTKPHFMWNFMLGHTDYIVQPIPFSIFMTEYRERGSSVVAQRLNLTPAEAKNLLQGLKENSLPQNREYRYNYLTNNCTTKVRDIIERYINGEVVYRQAEKKTYRECLHHYTEGHPWAELGDDMLLGASVDTILTDRSSAFLPERLMEFYAQAMIYDMEGNSRPMLVGQAEVLLQKQEMPVEPEFPLSPVMMVLCFAAFCLLVMACEIRFRRMIWGMDILVMLGQGLCGTLLTFMLLFSEHPSVDSNWQVWIFNPLPLLCMPWVVWYAIKRRFCLYHLINFSVLSLFVVFSPWISQHFAVTTIPLACILLTRPVSYYIYYKRTNVASQQSKSDKADGENPKKARKSDKKKV